LKIETMPGIRKPRLLYQYKENGRKYLEHPIEVGRSGFNM
jgi:hypothetical protein